MMRSSLAPALGALLLLASCASTTAPKKTDGGDTDGMQKSYCTPGATQSCFCLGAGQGTQVCRADGASYGSCTGCSADGFITNVSDMPAGNPCGNCDGCCNGTTCVTYQNQSNTECGVAGTVCGACSGGEVCDGQSGLCAMATDGCNDCSNGCCGTDSSGDATCYVNNAGQCGTGDGTCTACTHGTLCESGACDNHIDPNTEFRVIVSKTQVYNTDANDSCWESSYVFFCGQPNIQVCFGYDPGSGFVQGCTTIVDDVPTDNGETNTDPNTTDTATWDSTDGLIASNGQTFYIPGSAYANGKVVVTVQDVGSPTTIGSTYIAASNDYYTAYEFGSGFGRVVNVFWTLE